MELTKMKRIYLDMDGVLADLDRAVWEKYGLPVPERSPRPYEYDYSPFGVTREAFWRSLDHHFFASLPTTKEAPELLEMIRRLDMATNTVIVSQPTLEPGSWSGKVEWAKRHLPRYFYEGRFILTRDKLQLFNSSALLIDDHYDTCSTWQLMGGTCFCFPRPWNPYYDLEPEALQHLEEMLQTLFG